MDKEKLILIVDDRDENLQVLGTVLRKEGYSLAACSSGIDALEIMDSIFPSLILLDVMMPEMNGFETCKRIKEMPYAKDVPIIFLTADTSKESLVKGFDVVAVDYITKPFQRAELLSRVDTHLTIADQGQQLENSKNELNELLHVLCHDVLNPVGAARNCFQLAKEGDVNLNEDKELSEMIELSLDNAIDIVNNVRNMRALDEGKKRLELSPNNLSQMLLEGILMLRGRCKDKSITVNTEVDESITVRVDRVAFVNTVFNNVITNAIKFSPRNSVVNVTVAQSKANVEISISDKGIGIPKDMIDDLFSTIMPTNRCGTEGESGTGYGMPLIKKFIEALGGSIRVESVSEEVDSENHGTNVILVLPLS